MARSANGTIWVARDGRVSALEHGQLHAVRLNGTAAEHLRSGNRREPRWRTLGGQPTDESENGRTANGSKIWDRRRGRHRRSRAGWKPKKAFWRPARADRGLYLIFPAQTEKPLHFDQRRRFSVRLGDFIVGRSRGKFVEWHRRRTGRRPAKQCGNDFAAGPMERPRGAVSLPRTKRRVVGRN